MFEAKKQCFWRKNNVPRRFPVREAKNQCLKPANNVSAQKRPEKRTSGAIRRLRYDLRALRRFLILSLPLLVLTMGLFRFAQEMLKVAPDPAALSRSGASLALPAWVTIATWILEAVGLSALFLLIQGRGGSPWCALVLPCASLDYSLFQPRG